MRKGEIMRLIDADKLRKEIHMQYSDDLEILEKIDEQPTAYDVDKVISELKAHKNNEKMATSKLFDGRHRYYRAISVTKAIKIVKGENDGKEN